MNKIGLIHPISTLSIGVLLAIFSTSVYAAGTEADSVELSKIGIFNPENRPAIRGGLTADKARRMLEVQDQTTRDMIHTQLCDQPPTDKLCATLPNDNTDFSELFVYIFLSAAAQNSFDIFSWQSFIALNWPVDGDGAPLPSLTADGEHIPQWADYITPQELFASNQDQTICDSDSSGKFTLTTSNYLQPTGQPLIDQNLNYVVYDVRVNSIMADYMRQQGLTTVAGQNKFSETKLDYDFPVGYYTDPKSKIGGHAGSIALKTAWKVIDKSERKTNRFFTVNGFIAIPAEFSETGENLCIESTLGLVGMHIMRRTESGKGNEWIWSTFEHVDNAPLAVNSRRPNDVLHERPFEQGCLGPTTSDNLPVNQNPNDSVDLISIAKDYSFYNSSCADCETNALLSTRWAWSSTPPYTGKYAASGGKPTQVVQCWDVFDGTKIINREWQKKLQGTVWANYRSVSAQWRGANRGKMVPAGEVPRYMTNTTMETYEQDSPRGSCMSCHISARSVAGQSTSFSFLPSLLARYQ